jgi:hypothetical protein
MQKEIVWQFDKDTPKDTNAAHKKTNSISWKAHEFVAIQKTDNWFIVLGAVSAILLVFVFVVTKSIMSTVVIAAACGAIAYYARKPPELRTYSLDSTTLEVDTRQFELARFRSFSYKNEGDLIRYSFFQLQKLVPPISIYSTQKEFGSIVNILSEVLPVVEPGKDPIENLAQKFRF